MVDIENEIYKAIENNTGIRWLELKKKIVPDFCSDRTFRLTLKRMVVKKLVMRNEIDREHVEYHTKKSVTDLFIINVGLMFLGPSLDNNIDEFKKKYSKLTTLQKGKFVIDFISYLACGHFLYRALPFDNNSVDKQFFEKRIKEIFNIITENEKDSKQFGSLLGQLYADRFVQFKIK